MTIQSNNIAMVGVRISFPKKEREYVISEALTLSKNKASAD